MHALLTTLLLIMSLTSTLKSALQFALHPKMTLAAWSAAWQRGDDMMDDGGATSVMNPYAHSVWVQRAIKRVAEPISAVSLEFFTEGSKGEIELKNPVLTEFWKKPGIDRSGAMGRSDFIMASAGWWKLNGEFFWLLGDEWLLPRSAKGPLLIARPDRMRPIMEGQKLAGWEFTDAGGQRHALLKEQVVHLKAWNPYDDLRGLSEYESAKIAAESDYAAGKFALNLNAANGDRGVIVVAKGGMPSDQQQAQITAALREKANAARRGSFRPIFLTGDVEIEDPKVSAPDADFIASRIGNRHEIALAFGVPPSMFDVKASYSEGQSSDRYMLIVDTCMPLAEKIEDAIEQVSALLIGQSVEACFDWDEHDVMQAARRQRLDGVAKLWPVGVPMQQINDVLALGLRPFPGWEKSYLPFSVQEVGADAPLPTSDQPPAPPEDELPDAIDAMMRLVRTAPDSFERMQHMLTLKTVCTCEKCGGSFTFADQPEVSMGAVKCPHCGAIVDQEGHCHSEKGRCACRFPSAAEMELCSGDAPRVQLWKKHMKSRAKAVKRYRAKFAKVLMMARGQVLKKIEAKGPALLGKALETKAGAAADFLFDLAQFGHELKAEMRKAALATMGEAGNELFAELGRDDLFVQPPARAQQFIRERENLLTNVADSVFERIRSELQDGIDAGDSTDKLAARIRDEFNGIDEGRALTIAQTETGAAYGYARQDAMDQAGIDWKEWLTSGLDNVRATHLEAEGQRVRTNDAFKVGIVHLIAPGIPQSPSDNDPAEIINCHCVAIPVADGGHA